LVRKWAGAGKTGARATDGALLVHELQADHAHPFVPGSLQKADCHGERVRGNAGVGVQKKQVTGSAAGGALVAGRGEPAVLGVADHRQRQRDVFEAVGRAVGGPVVHDHHAL
jgi:hypothetical protein